MNKISFLSKYAISPLPIPSHWYALPLRLMVGYGFMEHGYAKLVRGPESFIGILYAMGMPFADVGEAIRASIGADCVEPWPLDDARQALGLFADALALDQTVSGQHARRVLAWEPHGPSLIADLSVQNHFQHISGA